MTTILDEKALPCPFCGCTDIVASNVGEDEDNWFVGCMESGCGVNPGVFCPDSEADAIAIWNRRTLATPSTGAVGEPVAWEYEFFGGNDIAPRWTRCVGLDDPRHTWGDTMVRSVRPLYASRSDTVGPEAGE
jgi:hypothetical protein